MSNNILLVEHNPDTIDTIKELLSYEFIEIYVAGDAETAKKLLDKYEIHMVITEALLPKSHGFILCQYVCEKYSGTKVIIIGEKLNEMDYKHEAQQHGACEFIEKPLNVKTFRKTVLTLLDIKESNGAEQYHSETTHINILPLLAEINAKKKKKSSKETSENKIDGITVKDDPTFEIKLD